MQQENKFYEFYLEGLAYIITALICCLQRGNWAPLFSFPLFARGFISSSLPQHISTARAPRYVCPITTDTQHRPTVSKFLPQCRYMGKLILLGG